ncbi:MAG: archaellin/type IV pilin N-terminal domain-containing protein [archaeon]
MDVLKKRGLSPVIATTLLVSITLVLAVIIFFWARSFVGETIEKNERAIEQSCELVDFFIEARSQQLFITNIGSVPIYAVEMRIKGLGEVKDIGKTGGTIGPGQSANFSLPSEATVGDTIIAVPILLGETTQEKVSHVCDADYGISAEVE